MSFKFPKKYVIERFLGTISVNGKYIDFYGNPIPIDINNIKSQGASGIRSVIFSNGMVVFWAISEDSVQEVISRIETRTKKKLPSIFMVCDCNFNSNNCIIRVKNEKLRPTDPNQIENIKKQLKNIHCKDIDV
jgi:uncharacterized Rmd1/YagE family protein